MASTPNRNDRDENAQNEQRQNEQRQNEQRGQSAEQNLGRQATEMADRALGEVGERSSQNLEVVAQAAGVMVTGFQQVTRELVAWNQEALRQSFNRFGREGMMPSNLMSMQADLARESLQRSFEGARRIGEIFIRMSEDAQRAMERSGGGRDGGRFDEQDEVRTAAARPASASVANAADASSIAARARRSGRHASLQTRNGKGRACGSALFCVRQEAEPRTFLRQAISYAAPCKTARTLCA